MTTTATATVHYSHCFQGLCDSVQENLMDAGENLYTETGFITDEAQARVDALALELQETGEFCQCAANRADDAAWAAGQR